MEGVNYHLEGGCFRHGSSFESECIPGSCSAAAKQWATSRMHSMHSMESGKDTSTHYRKKVLSVCALRPTSIRNVSKYTSSQLCTQRKLNTWRHTNDCKDKTSIACHHDSCVNRDM